MFYAGIRRFRLKLKASFYRNNYKKLKKKKQNSKGILQHSAMIIKPYVA